MTFDSVKGRRDQGVGESGVLYSRLPVLFIERSQSKALRWFKLATPEVLNFGSDDLCAGR
jgi:hypothetical protein